MKYSATDVKRIRYMRIFIRERGGEEREGGREREKEREREREHFHKCIF